MIMLLFFVPINCVCRYILAYAVMEQISMVTAVAPIVPFMRTTLLEALCIHIRT